MNSNDILKKLLSLLKPNCSSCPTAVKKELGQLSISESDELNSMNAENSRLEKIIDELSQDTIILSTRKKLFYSKLEKRLQTKNSITIENDKAYSFSCSDNCSNPSKPNNPFKNFDDPFKDLDNPFKNFDNLFKNFDDPFKNFDNPFNDPDTHPNDDTIDDDKP